MQRVALVTDSTAALSAELADELGIHVVPASFAFAEVRHLDGDLEWAAVYARMRSGGVAPRTFGVAETGFRAAITEALESHEEVFCLVAPFDVNPSFTTACAAMLAIQFDEPGAKIKVANAGVGSAGLGALLMTLAALARDGAGIAQLAEALDELEPRSDSLCVPADPSWLERTGRMTAIEDRLGALDGRIPLVRIGTRFTGVAAADDFESALGEAVAAVGKRAGGAPLNAVVTHADAPHAAKVAAEQVKSVWDVRRLEVAPLSATHGSQLGPGAIGIGVCPIGLGGGTQNA